MRKITMLNKSTNIEYTVHVPKHRKRTSTLLMMSVAAPVSGILTFVHVSFSEHISWIRRTAVGVKLFRADSYVK